MRDADTPSVTAAWVAFLRGVAATSLPPAAAALAPDELSVALAGQPYAAAHGMLRRVTPRWLASRGVARGSLRAAALQMALRTRALDDVARAFLDEGGAQVVLLGAGLDARPLRLAPSLRAANATVFEVDAPGSQRAKRAALERLPLEPLRGLPCDVRFVALDFERNSLEALTLELKKHGLRADKPTLIIWEGVLPYLSARAVDACLDAAREWGAPGASLLALNHMSAEAIAEYSAKPRWYAPRSWRFWRLFFAAARVRAGEVLQPPPWGVAPDGAREHLQRHGWRLLWDRDDEAVAAFVGLPPQLADAVAGTGMHTALAQLQPVAAGAGA